MTRRRIKGDEWADGGAITDPGDVQTDTGWVAEKPPYQWMNWVQNRADQQLAHLEEQAVSDWDTSTEYLEGGFSIGSDRLLYRAVTGTIGVDPVTASSAFWAEYVPPSSETVSGIIEIATVGEVADGTAPDKAVTPLGMLARTATENRTGLVELANVGEAQALSATTLAVTPAGIASLVAGISQRGILRTAAASDVAAGTDTAKAVTPAALAAGQSLTADGYITLPGGLIVQWGSDLILSETLSNDVTLPIAFTTSFFAAFASSMLGGTNENDNDAGAEPLGLTQIRLGTGLNNRTVYWLAIGI